MWWEIDTTAAPIQVGLIDDPTGANFYFFPSIAVNKNNDVLIGFAVASATIHPSCGYALHMNTDAASTWRPIYTYRHGLKTYYQTFGGAQDRWGDYSATSVDPKNDLDFWTLQESVPNYSGSISSSIWDTWWAHVQICPTVTTPTPATITAGPCEGTTVPYSVNAVTGAVSYTWTVTGTGWSGSSSTNSINLLVGSGTATITVVANSACASSTAYTFTVTPTPLPTTPVITATTAACVGSPSATYTATSTGATSWSWSVSGAGWSGSSSTSTLSTTVGSGAGTLVVSATNACGTTYDTLVVTPGVPPILDSGIIISGLLCSGKVVTAYSYGITGATSYNWIISGTGWGTSSTTIGDSTYVTIGTDIGTIIVHSINGCGTGPDDTLTGLGPVPTPSASFSLSTHVTTTSSGATATYTGTAPGSVTYTWDFGSGGTGFPGAGAGPQSISWSTVGTKTVTVTVSNSGCTSTFTDTVLVTWPLNIGGIGNNANVSVDIIPNPNNGNFDVVFGKVDNKHVAVKLFDMQGRVVFSERLSVNNNSNKVSIATNNLPEGTYMANIVVDGTVATKKITISR